MNKSIKKLEKIGLILFSTIIVAIGSYFNFEKENQEKNTLSYNKISYEISNIPTYNGKIYMEVNDNIPKFTDEDKNIEEDYYSNLENGRVRNGDGKN